MPTPVCPPLKRLGGACIPHGTPGSHAKSGSRNPSRAVVQSAVLAHGRAKARTRPRARTNWVRQPLRNPFPTPQSVTHKRCVNRQNAPNTTIDGQHMHLRLRHDSCRKHSSKLLHHSTRTPALCRVDEGTDPSQSLQNRHIQSIHPIRAARQMHPKLASCTPRISPSLARDEAKPTQDDANQNGFTLRLLAFRFESRRNRTRYL